MQKKSSKPSDKSNVLVVLATLGQRTELLRETLTSIKKQSYKNIDVVLVYPLKNKETHKLALEFNAQELDDPGSMSGAVNAGIESAGNNYKYVTWIGDDDLLTPKSIAASVAALDKNTDAVAAFGYCNYINSEGRTLFTSRAGRFAPWIMTWGPNLVPLPGAVFRLSSLKKLDYIFDVELRYSMDLDLFLRLRKIGKLINVEQPVSCFRWHPDSATVSGRGKSLEEAEMVKRRYLPKSAKLFAPLWEGPIRFATHVAAKRVNKMAKK